jgi:hypothetical protein
MNTILDQEFISAIEGNDWLSIRVAIHKNQPTVIAIKKQPNNA